MVVCATFKYDEPEVEIVARGRRANDRVSSVLSYDFELTFNFYHELGERRSTPFARWPCCTIRGLHANKLKCKFLLSFGDLL